MEREDLEGEKAGRVGKVLNLSGDLAALDLRMLAATTVTLDRGASVVVTLKLVTRRQDRAGWAAAVPTAMRAGRRLY